MTTSPPSSSEARASSSFHRLHPGVQRWIWQQGWTELRPVQERAVPLVLDAERDAIITAATAGGKTEAAFLPIASSLAAAPTASVGCLCLSPLKALINDQAERLEGLCGAAGVPVHRWHGDVPAARKHAVLGRPSGVLLITPESLEASFVLRGSQMPELFSELRYVVVDELHAFIGSERGRHLQSLLHRVEAAIGRTVPRVALSATLGDMALAAEFLRPGRGAEVALVESDHDSRELKLQLRGYRRVAPEPEATSEPEAEGDDEAGDLYDMASHLFRVLRGSDNLIFTNARSRVERLADLLRRLSERERVPNEFLPHHGSLSPELREDAEALLKDPARPGNIICTTTLELGIDVGSVASIAQVDAPQTTAAMRQRLGRSGRRDDDPAVLRLYLSEEAVTPDTPLQDQLRSQLVQTIATVELLLARWYEPPIEGQLHLSTLVHQVLSVIAERSGSSPLAAYRVLCAEGPFTGVSPPMFASLLRAMGRHDLISQTQEGTLVLGLKGERLVDHYSFFAAFQSPQEYRLVCDGRTLGSLPLASPVAEGSYLIFAGRRWLVVRVDQEVREIQLRRAEGGRAPAFSGAGAPVHDRAREKMRQVYLSDEVPRYLDAGARSLLAEGRSNFRAARLAERALVTQGEDVLLFPWRGDRAMHTLALLLSRQGLRAYHQGLSILVAGATAGEVRSRLGAIAAAKPPVGPELAAAVANRQVEKFDHFLPGDLSCQDYASRALDPLGGWEAAKELA